MKRKKEKKLGFHHWLCIKVFCASKLLSRKLFFSSNIFPSSSIRLNLFLHFQLRVLILSLCYESSRKRSVCILIACDLVFLCIFYARLSFAYVHGISSIVQMKCLRCLFMNSLGATVQAICTSNGTICRASRFHLFLFNFQRHFSSLFKPRVLRRKEVIIGFA